MNTKRFTRMLLALAAGAIPLVSAPHAGAEIAGLSTLTGLAVDDAPAQDGSETKPSRQHQVLLGAQAFWAANKVMPGVAVRLDLHELFWLDVEGGFVFVVNPPPENDAFIGSTLGAHALVAPFRTKQVELGAGLGADVHLLWGINADITEVALALLVSGAYWFTPKIGVFGSARVYPVATSGLHLGEHRDGSKGLPVLFATGVAWSFP